MKKIYILSLLLAGTLSFGQASDAFAGTGALNANGWISHSGNTPGQVSKVAGSLSYAGLTSVGNKTQIVSGNTEDVSLTSASALTTAGYYSAIINVVNTTTLTANTGIGDYSLMFGTINGGTLSNFTGRIYVKTGSISNTFNIGLLNASGGTATPTFSAVDFPVGTPIFIVVKYTIANNSASLWINPVIGAAEGTPTLTNATGTSTAPTQLERFAIRQGTSTGNIEIDEVRIGSTYAFVTSSVLSVKDNTISGLAIYPNPVTGKTFNVSTANNSDMSVAIFDVIGKQVLNTKVINNTVNVANLNAGIYIVKITEAGKTATRKLIIK